MNLSEKKCVPCEGGAKPFTSSQIQEFFSQLQGGWEVVDSKKIQKKFTFKDFNEAIDFVHKVAEVAESEGHHPDIHINYNKVVIELFTHAIGGLSENDFILASKVDQLTT